MNRTLPIHRMLTIVVVPLSLLLFIYLAGQWLLSHQQVEWVSYGLMIDLLMTIPLIYFLLIRKTDIPKTTILPILFLGVFIGTEVIPTEHQTFLLFVKNWGIPVIELSIISWIGYKVYTSIKRYQFHQVTEPDFYHTLKATCMDLFPAKVAIIFVTEISVIYFGFLRWKRKTLKSHEFTYHQKNGVVAIFGVLIGLIVVETFVFHLLIQLWSPIAAWVFTILGIYTLIQIFGFMKSMFFRPITFRQEVLFIPYGILGEATISYHSIESVEISKRDISNKKEILKLSPLGALDQHNIILHFHESIEVKGLYGMKKKTQKLAIFVDDPQRFHDSIEIEKE